MSKEDKAHADGFEAGYLLALADLRALVDETLAGVRSAQEQMGAFYQMASGIHNGLHHLVAQAELRGLKILASRRRP